MRGARRGAPLENYMVEYQWFDSRQVHFTVHLCEAIVLRCRSLAFKRCTGVWRPEADESPFQGDEEGVSPPRGQREARGVGPAGAGVLRCLSGAKTKDPRNSIGVRGSRRTAATYSPNWWVSTIGDGELNFSVRNGKRWILTAITTAVYYLREKFSEGMFPSGITVRSSLLLGLSFS